MAINRISLSLAQEIVNAVKEVVDKDINFIDINGMIIGSTDEKRLNTFHEAGYEAIKNLKNVTVECSDEYKGSRKGINYPIKINRNAAGAIGITGEPDEISKYGFLVTKITEIFIKEQELNYKYEADKQRINYVVKSLIYDNIEDKNEIENILSEFGILPNQKFAVVIMKIDKCHDAREIEIIENDIKKVFDSIGNIFKIYIYPNEFIALVNTEKYDKLKSVYMDILEKYHGILIGGVGRLKELYETYNSYQEARIALKYASKNREILTYLDTLNLEIILESVDTEVKKQYIDKILKKLDKEDIKLLEVYYKNDMSLKGTSEEFYIHKNTLQYRLERINQKSGFNPRHFNESVVLYLAIRLMT
ncbi:MAG: sugar diacid recognition domain-containing protein [Clostridium sp.]|uniref:CdaR family transcriptional regulator n=1 Tax=Clostridium sp. TaxID=1506 RepID=UPI00306070CA